MKLYSSKIEVDENTSCQDIKRAIEFLQNILKMKELERPRWKGGDSDDDESCLLTDSEDDSKDKEEKIQDPENTFVPIQVEIKRTVNRRKLKEKNNLAIL